MNLRGLCLTVRGRISTILLYSGYPKFLEAGLQSLASQSRASDEICVVDLGISANAREVLQPLLNESHVPQVEIIERKGAEETLPELLRRVVESLNGEYIFLLPSHNLLVPTCLEIMAGALDGDTQIAAICTDVKLFGMEDAIISPSIPELLAYPERDCYPLYRSESLKKIGGFTEENDKTFLVDAVLRLIDSGHRVEFIPQWLVLSRYEEHLHNPQLHKFSILYDRKSFLERFENLVAAHAKEIVLCLEKEHWRQFQRAENAGDNVHNTLADLRTKHRELEKLHNEALSSVSVTGAHLISALKKKILPCTK